MEKDAGAEQFAVSIAQVQHVAGLAALEFSQEEEQQLARELNRVLDYMKVLREVNTEGIEATFQVIPLVNCFREDQVDPSLSVAEVLKNAPEAQGDYVKMVPILEGGEE